MTSKKDIKPEDIFNQEVYDRLLFDEDFQEMRRETLSSLPDSSKKMLSQADQDYIAGKEPPEWLSEKILGDYAKRAQQSAANNFPQKESWFSQIQSKIASFNLAHPFMAGGGFVTAGLALGIFLNLTNSGISDPALSPMQSNLAQVYAGELPQSIVSKVVALANNGDANAQNKLGDLYFYGAGVKQSYKEAYNWHQKAAKQGHTIAKYNLSIANSNGLGVEKNTEKAKVWFDSAQKFDR